MEARYSMRFRDKLGVATRFSIRFREELGVAAMFSMRFCGELGVAARCARELIKASDSSMHSLSWQVRLDDLGLCGCYGAEGEIFQRACAIYR